MKNMTSNGILPILIAITNLVMALNSNLAVANQEMKIEKVQPFWPASCDANFDTSRKYLSYQYAGIHAVNGRIKKAEITAQSTVSIEGSYYGYTCERVKGPKIESESAPKHFIWRPAFLRNNRNVEVYIQSKFETFFKLDLIDDHQFKIEIPLDQFFSAEDLRAVMRGENPRNNRFHLVFVLLTDEGVVPSGYIPPSYTYIYSLSSDQKTIELKLLK